MEQKEYLELKEKELRDALGTVHAIQASNDPTVVYRDSRPITDLKNMIETSAKEFGDRPAFWRKKTRKDAYEPITYRKYLEDINGLGTALIAMGQQDRRIGVIGANCYEWAVGYMAVVCGTGIVWNAKHLAGLPIRIYHGDDDPIVPFEESVSMLRELTRAGADVKLTICYGVGHNAWETAYTDPDLIDWMLAQKRKG